jgi:hypothetical protein
MKKLCLLLTLLAGLIIGCSTPLPPPAAAPSAQGNLSTDPTPTQTAAALITDTPAATPTETTTPGSAEPVVGADPNDQGLNLLVAVSGEVQLRRLAWPDYQRTGFGVGLQRGDLLKLAAGAEAVILCDNLSLWRIPGGPAPAGLNGCPRPESPALTRRGVKIAGTRGGDPNVPYIISPRSTKLLNPLPLLRWNAPPGVSSYTVELRGGEIPWQQEGVTTTSLVYPGEPPLEPGVTYLLVVVDDTGHSSQDEGARGLGFSILSEAEAEKITQQREQISGLELSEAARQYALAQYEASQSLIAESIERLEQLVASGSEEAAVHQALADLYAQIGLWLLAEALYTNTLVLAEQQQNLEILAASRARLGEVKVKLGQAPEAIDLLAQAKNDYETLGEVERAAELDELLELLGGNE